MEDMLRAVERGQTKLSPRTKSKFWKSEKTALGLESRFFNSVKKDTVIRSFKKIENAEKSDSTVNYKNFRKNASGIKKFDNV